MTYPTADTALNEIEAVSDNCVNAEVYTTADALADLQEIRNIIRRHRIREPRRAVSLTNGVRGDAT